MRIYFNKENLFDYDTEKILEFSKIKGTPSEIRKNFDVSGLDGWDELVTIYDSLKHRGVDNVRINFGRKDAT